jgi:glucokinase
VATRVTKAPTRPAKAPAGRRKPAAGGARAAARGTKAPRGGIDLGGTKIQAAIVDTGNKVIGQARRPTPTTGGPEDVAEAMAEGLLEAAADAGIEAGALVGVGVGSPGDVDGKTGTVMGARNLPGWEGSFPLAQRLSEKLDVKVRVGNDVGVAVDGEAQLGAGRGYNSLLGVFWGTGVGGGIIIDGKHWLGRGAAGEIGHVVVRQGGARCGCGRRGCMEAYAGRASMEARARREVEKGRKTDLFKIMEQKQKDRLTSAVWAKALEHGDKLAIELIDRAVTALGTGVASAVNLLDVEAVIVGGGLGLRLGQPYVERIEKQMGKHVFVRDNPPDIRLAALGDLGGAIGASLLVA